MAGTLDVLDVSSECVQPQQHRALGRCRTLDLRKTSIPAQGRFEPVHDPAVCPGGAALGGYLYLGLSVGAVVAEEILRGQDIPPDLIIRKRLLAGKSLAQLVLDEDVDNERP
ncbi:hypothetical protein R4282_06645 [Rhodococcus oxybenzonivorans]|uniref:hypothetical protein n=1 Tax=Rhodococcus TaxID=1827 RepID=UPI0020308CF6|nr:MULTISPECIES: hypothetical protein [Rhodococcus]MDV7352696.1 hypothetical protein [Rhodococcus oxybenzonivorans]